MLRQLLLSNEDFYSKYKDTPLHKVHCIGTHDSACYQLIHGHNNVDKVKKLDYARYICCVNKIVKDWTLTQDHDIIQQLKMGVKALDLRVMYDVNKRDFFFSHTLLCVRADEVLEQIRAYLDSNPLAFIYIFIKPDSEHMISYTANIAADFKTMLRKILGKKLVTMNVIFPTISQCLLANQQVFCTFSDESDIVDDIWSNSYLYGTWVQATDREMFYQQVRAFVDQLPPYAIKHIPLPVTPTTDIVTADVKSRFACHGAQSVRTFSEEQEHTYERLSDEGANIDSVNIWWLDYL